MTAYLYSQPGYIAGAITRQLQTDVEPAQLSDTHTPDAFGIPVKMVSGKLEKIQSGDAASVFYGILARSVPSIPGSASDSTPNIDSLNSVVRQGYVAVVCSVGTPARGGVVYLRITASGGDVVGQLETAADSGKCVALTGVTWAIDGKETTTNYSEIYIA